MRRIDEAQDVGRMRNVAVRVRGGDRNKRAGVEIDQDYCRSGGDLFAAATSTPGKAIAPLAVQQGGAA